MSAAIEPHPQPAAVPKSGTMTRRDLLILGGLTLIGGVVAYIDNQLGFHTILVETIHALVVTGILVFCIISQYRNPQIKQFGWNNIIWGLTLLMIGSWVDILDDPPMLPWFDFDGDGDYSNSFGRSWQQAFIKKILGYTVGIGMVAVGFYQWVPWMIRTRDRIAEVNKQLKTTIMGRDDQVESARLTISRELHDDVAQRLTFLTMQVQLCQTELQKAPAKAIETLAKIGADLSECLKSVRQISHNLRPRSLYALGFVPALEEFLEKCRTNNPGVTFNLNVALLPEDHDHIHVETLLDDRQLLHLFRVLQEGVRNAIKHSNARHIDVKVQEHVSQYVLEVIDDGHGLPWPEVPDDDTLVQQGHLGIAGLRERVLELGAEFQLTSPKETGTVMEVRLTK
ncbi:MAG: sensor histidine kinase [Vampirovibrio sp.]|nr:sensor histidine kinase [Vampirovibrio sp.]